MSEQIYTYSDFIKTLDESKKHIVDTVNNHMANHYPEYKPFNIKPLNKTLNKWQMNYRKKPEFGRAFCSLYSVDGKLAMRVIGIGFMYYELLLRQNEFNEKIRNYFYAGGLCGNCGKKCYHPFREFWFVNGEILASGCKYRQMGVIDDYPVINDVDENDIKDILFLLDIQSRHISKPKNTKEVRGSGYGENCKSRCGDVREITLNQIETDIDDFELSDYCIVKKIEKYSGEYSLTPMGVYDGLWFYHDIKAVCGETGNAYKNTIIPEGCYLTVTISNPLTFSAWSTWAYIAGWMRDNDVNIRQIRFDDSDVPFFTKFYRQNGSEYMAVYVPIE
jgi:hypothetical protein